MADQLPQGQIQPVAQPIDTFLRPIERPIAGAAQQPGIPRVSGQEVISQGNGGNVQGANNLQALAAALAPFNARLQETVGAGLELYASSEYKKGQNEAAKAAVLANQQRLQSMGQYAAANRQLDGKDPIAAMAMDSINPYRRAGRENALARVAAEEVGPALMEAYRKTPGLEQLDESDPRIAQLKVDATNGLMKRYGLTAGSPGFLDYVNPELVKGWQRVTERQYNDRQEYLKATIPGTATAEAAGIYANAYSTGQIQVFDAAGKPTTLTPADGARWEAGLLLRMQATVDKVMDESGLKGETTKAREKVIEQLHAAGIARGDATLQRLARQLAVGPAGPDGARPKAAVAMFAQLLDQQIKYEDYADKKKLDGYGATAAVKLAAAGGDPAMRQKAINELGTIAGQMGIPADKALERIAALGGTVDKLQGLVSDAGPAEQFMLQAETTRFGPQWNTQQFLQETEYRIQALPDADKTRLRNQAGDIVRRKENEKTADLGGAVSRLIEDRIRANTQAAYPKTVTAAALRKNGSSISSMMAWGPANVAESVSRQNQALQVHVRNRLAAEAAKNGGRLSSAQQLQFAADALNEYGSKNPDAKAWLFPGVGKTPSVGGAGAAGDPPPPPPGARSAGGGAPDPKSLMGPAPADKPAASKPAAQAIPVTRFPANQLDQADPSTFKQFRKTAILTPESIRQEVLNLANGGQAPAPLKRAARQAGVSPAEFLLKQAERYPNGLSLPDDMKKAILRDGRQSRAAGDYLRGLPGDATQPSLVAQGQNWLLDVLSSVITQPAYATTSLDVRPRAGSYGPAYGGRNVLGVGQLASLAQTAGFTGKNAAIMAAIAMAESSGKPWNHNPNRATGDNSYGLWQINMIDGMGPERRREFGISKNEALFDPVTNAKAARAVHASQGFGAWSVYRSGAYRQFLPAAMRAIGNRRT